MSKKLLLGIIVILLITNIATLLLWNTDKNIVLESDGEKKKINSKKPVAIIDGKRISYDEWMASLRMHNGESRLKTMIDQTVVDKLAKQRNIRIDEKIIERDIALLLTMQGVMTKEETARKVKNWRESIIHRYQLEALLTEDNNISAEKISKYYEEYHKQYDFQASRQFSHIVVENSETAEKVMQELEQGASFDLLAQEYSIDEDTKDDGGYLGFFVKGNSFIPDAYMEKAVEMDERTYSKPIEVNNGLAIVYLHRKLPAITFTYDEIKPYIEWELALEKSGKSLTASPLWDSADIEWVYEE